MSKHWLLVCVLCLALLPTPAIAEDDAQDTFTLSGSVFTSSGDEAGTTYIKVDSSASVPSENGVYSFPGITPGEHTVRAYFMNDGHTVAYRTVYIDQDMTLDWYEGHNWITAAVLDSSGQPISDGSGLVVELNDPSQTSEVLNGMVEFGPFHTGSYHMLSMSYNGTVDERSYACVKLNPGSASSPRVNHLTFQEGTNSIFGYVVDGLGFPVPQITVSNGVVDVQTTEDGFYSMSGLEVGTTAELTFTQGGQEVVQNHTQTIDYGPLWANFTASISIELPHNATFVTTTTSVPLGRISLEWDGGEYTDYYSLYDGEIKLENLLYRGSLESYEFTPSEAGTYEFKLQAHNRNGTNPTPDSLVMIVLPNQNEDNLWSAGMHWNYSLVHTPEYRSNRTYTAIGVETIVDAFGRDRDTFLVRVTDDTYQEGEKSYRWVDANSLLTTKSYWVDAPSSSSYFQEGIMGWNFSIEGDDAQLFGNESAMDLHFNRTNIIGVPGHPNGYDDTTNTVTIQHNVSLMTDAGTFDTTYIKITDQNDGIVSWEMWYNSTVRNYVKIVDRLPGSHSEMVVYELTGYYHPQSPQFLTESGNQSNSTYAIEWSNFDGTQAYQLLENGIEIYRGDATSYEVGKRSDGVYEYQINAIMGLEYVLQGGVIELAVDFVPPVPVISTPSQTMDEDELVNLSWTGLQEVQWYTVSVEQPDGTITEVYNGSDPYVELEDLVMGQNRIRVTAMVDGKLSEPSPSVFITVESSENGSNSSLNSLSFGSVIVLTFFAAMYQSLRRRR